MSSSFDGIPDPRQLLDAHLPDAQSRPWVPIPEGTATARIGMIAAGTLRNLRSKVVRLAVDEEDRDLSMPDFAFLIEHGDERVVFDLGIKCPVTDYQPSRQAAVKSWNLRCDRTLQHKLSEAGVDPKTISRVILSHHHFDHVGNFEQFAKRTSLVVGPGVIDDALPGYPTNPDGSVLDTDIPKERTHELSFEKDKWESIGASERAHDFFGDGSVWLLDTPGHMVGHLSALVRLTPSPNATYVVLAGDASHHRATFSPTYPQKWKRDIGVYKHASQNRLACLDDDLPTALETMASLARFELEDGVLVLIAHDGLAEGVVPELPAYLDDVRAYKQRIREREQAGDGQ